MHAAGLPRECTINSFHVCLPRQTPVSQHQLPPLAGTKISVTGFDPRAKDQLAALIARGGGAHSPELHTSCTHLIAEAAGSPKFE
jgi:twin BRCT domain